MGGNFVNRRISWNLYLEIKVNTGTNKIKVVFEKGGFNLNYLDFKESKKWNKK